MDRFDDPWQWKRPLLGSGPGRGVRVVLAWHESSPGQDEHWEAPAGPGGSWRSLSATTPSEVWDRRQVGSTALAPSKTLHPTALLDAEFDPQRLVKHPVTVLDLGRVGLHVITGVRPGRDRDHWLGIEENGAFVWSKVVLRSLSEPSVGTFLARYSFAGSCPFELIRRAIVGRPTALKRDTEPGRA